MRGSCLGLLMIAVTGCGAFGAGGDDADARPHSFAVTVKVGCDGTSGLVEPLIDGVRVDSAERVLASYEEATNFSFVVQTVTMQSADNHGLLDHLHTSASLCEEVTDCDDPTAGSSSASYAIAAGGRLVLETLTCGSCVTRFGCDQECDPMAQTGCEASDSNRCAVLTTALSPPLAYLSCAPRGTNTVGQNCNRPAPGMYGFDSCVGGSTCALGKCRALCDDDNPCASGTTCVGNNVGLQDDVRYCWPE